MYIILAILIFGILIATHELGHFLAARLFGVKVTEFAIGMGPTLWKKQGKETLYSLRALPFGGFCAMSEDEASEDPRAFTNQHPLKRAVILVAGSAVNFLVGFLVILALTVNGGRGYQAPVITSFLPNCPYESQDGFQIGDRIVKINGERIRQISDISMFVERTGPLSDIELIRDGEKLLLKNYPLKRIPYEIDGQTGMYFGFRFESLDNSPVGMLKDAWYQALNYVRLVRISLVDLVTGGVSVKELSGPVGIVGMMNEWGQDAQKEYGVTAGILSTLTLGTFIAINLAVVNMLPVPALDGGRVLFLVLTWILESIIRKKIDPKYEGYIHAAGLILLLSLMVFVLYNDIVRMITG